MNNDFCLIFKKSARQTCLLRDIKTISSIDNFYCVMSTFSESFVKVSKCQPPNIGSSLETCAPSNTMKSVRTDNDRNSMCYPFNAPFCLSDYGKTI